MRGLILDTSQWYHAQNLRERIELFGGRLVGAARHETVLWKRIERWRMLFPFLRGEFLNALAASHMVGEEVLLRVLCDPIDAWTPAPTRPKWVDDLNEACFPAEFPSKGQSPLAGFMNLVAPWIAQALQRLESEGHALLCRHPDAPFDLEFLIDTAWSSLPSRVLPVVTPTLALELNLQRIQGGLAGETSEERFQSFCELLCDATVARSLLQEYPVLARCIVETLGSWVDFTLEFFEHLSMDWKDLDRVFAQSGDPGRLARVRWHKGDSHRGGRHVVGVETTTGLGFVYKPRGLAVDLYFQKLLRWLNQLGILRPLPTLRILDRQSYGWVEFIEYRACKSKTEICRFYERQGAYLALLHVLEATDIHFENTIACGENPYLVDLETLFHPRFDPNLAVRDPARAMLHSSVLRVGLLPHRSFETAVEEGVDFSGIGGGAGQTLPFAVPTWQSVATDEMHLRENRGTTRASQNLPTLEGESVDVAEYADSLVAGFTAMYNLLREHRDALLADDGPLTSFGNAETRVVFRPTVVYFSLRQASYHPDMLRDAMDRDTLFASLWHSTKHDPRLARIVKGEIEQLRVGDIPLFLSRPVSSTLWTSSGECLGEFVNEPPMSRVKRKLNELGDTDLKRQLWVVRASLTAVAGKDHPRRARQRVTAKQRVDRTLLLEEACRIGAHLEQRALLGGAGSVSWIDIFRNPKQHWSLGAPGIGLYDGLPGIAMFCAYLATETGQPRFDILARGALETLCGHLSDRRDSAAMGAFDGLGGVVYLLTHLGSLWNEDALLQQATDVACTVVEQVARDQTFDVIGGSAGCLVSLLGLYKVAPSEELARGLVSLGDHLLERAAPQARGVAWCTPIPAKAPLTGFGHGASGIAWSLLELSRITGRRDYQDTAMKAFAYERHCYSASERNWPDFRTLRDRKEPAFVRGWCHGSPGIVLARLRAIQYADCPELRTDIAAGMETIDEAFEWGHCLCHGDLGNLEVLLQASQILRAQVWHEKFEYRLARTLESGRCNGWLLDSPAGLESLGLMTGLAGIGLGLLRAASPSRVPSVLLLSSPATPGTGVGPEK